MTSAREIRVAKVTLNIGAGKSTERLEKGVKLFEMITKKKPVKTITQKRIAGWGLRPGLPIGCKITIRGEAADKILKQMLGAVDNKLKPKQFDDEGNISFGIKEYIDVPGLDYNPEIGVLGFQVCATLERHGFRIKRRLLMKRKVGKNHRITSQDSIEFMKKKFGAIIEEE
jgi:large subunit ribosomal protein L5